MAKKGNFAAVPPEKLFTWLYDKKKTGTLTVVSKAEQKWLFLRDGKVVHAQSKSDRDRLESVLLRERVVSEAALREFSAIKNGKNLAQYLLERSILSPAILEKMKKFQVRDITLSVFDWQEGEFVFQ